MNSCNALRTFQQGIFNNEIKLLVKSCRFTTLSDAVSKASEEESLSHCGPSSSNSNNNASQPIKCQICKKKGHFSDVCFQRYKPPVFDSKNFSAQSKFQNFSKNNKVCAYCKNKGHHINECRKKAAADKNKSDKSYNDSNQQQENSQGLEKTQNTAVRVHNLKTQGVHEN